MGIFNSIVKRAERALSVGKANGADVPETPRAPSSRYVDPRPVEERIYVEQFAAESEIDRLRRRSDEYFEIIERIEAERDGLWRMYRVSVSEHLNAQALLERHLMTTRNQLGRAVAMLNKMRVEQQMAPIKRPDDLEPYEGEPVGVAKRYADSMIALCNVYSDKLQEARPPMTNGTEERGHVAAAD